MHEDFNGLVGDIIPMVLLYMLHGDADVLVLLKGTCIYFDWILCAYDWVSVD